MILIGENGMIDGNVAECIEAFEDVQIWNGKTFWNVENQMQWVDE